MIYTSTFSIGIDIGSVSINMVAVDGSGAVVGARPYLRHFGRFLDLLPREYKALLEELGSCWIDTVAFTGTHGEAVARSLDLPYETETSASLAGMSRTAPEAGSVVSIGGFDSAFFSLGESMNGRANLREFKLNEACAAGTGSFIDQQAERIFMDEHTLQGIEDPQQRIENTLDRFVELGMESDDPASVACRCTVFTKSDMIHLQNRGIKTKHIIRGLHRGVAKSFKSTLISNIPVRGPVYMIGGCAMNRLVRISFEELLGETVLVPEHAYELGALGAVLKAREDRKSGRLTAGKLASLSDMRHVKAPRGSRLKLALSSYTGESREEAPPPMLEKTECYLGLDVGSTTTKAVLIRPDGSLLYKRYIPTEGRPILAIKKCFRHLVERFGHGAEVLGAGTTGSGREVASLFVGADDVVNEITAHALGTVHKKPDVDTIFELGGQDAKYTRLVRGAVQDFRMNKVCAAGTGSFLEEMANKLGVAIDGEYERLAMESKQPLKLAERCTVFMESDMMSLLQQGASTRDLLAGLACAVVHNYLNRVKGKGGIGEVISFQGGPSLNKAVVAAFEQIVGKRIITLPDREVIGAIGAALHARDEVARIREKEPGYRTRFHGFGVKDEQFVHEEDVCTDNKKCHNKCKLQVYHVGGKRAVYGGDCGLHEGSLVPVRRKKAPDFFSIRNRLWFKAMKGRYIPLEELGHRRNTNGRPLVGIPRALSFHQLGLFWVHLFYEMGFMPVISPKTDEEIVLAGISAMTCDACFPVKLAHGHTLALDGRCDFMFVPVLVEMDGGDSGRRGFYCPFQQGNFHMMKAAVGLSESSSIHPVLRLHEGRRGMEKAFRSEFERLGLKLANFRDAWEKARRALDIFSREIRAIGRAALNSSDLKRAVVVVSRPYALYDARTNLNLFRTFSRLGVVALPMEFLDIGEVNTSGDYKGMYWGFGDDILRAAGFLDRDERLFGLYLTSFSCGPDSFVLHYFSREMRRIGRPYLELELDEHSAGAGVETRLLAFLDVIRNHKPGVRKKAIPVCTGKASTQLMERTVYVPFMGDGAFMIAAAFRALGINSDVIPTYTSEGLEFGRRNTSGKECFPCTVTTGDMFHQITRLRERGSDIENGTAFFMPSADGPCRFGQYSRLHRMLLDTYGYHDIPIISPNSEDAYQCGGLLDKVQAREFRKLAYAGLALSDLLEMARCRVRPYEKCAGESDRAFEACMKLGAQAVGTGRVRAVLDAATEAARLFEAIPVSEEERPRVGVVGEIYVRSHEHTNQQLKRELEKLGTETVTSPVTEWIDYSTLGFISAAKRKKAFGRPSVWKELGSLYVANWWQRRTHMQLFAPFARLLAGFADHSVSELLDKAGDLLTPELRGEAILSIGAALAFVHSGFDGVVNAMPFTCMPSTIASSILKSRMRGYAPYIDMIYDGTVLPNRKTNLSTFAHQVHQRFREKEHKR